MTQATINRNGQAKRVAMTIAEKARLLEVIDYEPGTFAVRSNSDPRIAYAVSHANFKVTDCACTGCRMYGRKECAYRLAAQNRLNDMRRAWYTEVFEIYA